MKKPNIVLILLDGARWDRLEKSQEFQKIINKGTLLNNVNTAIPYTIGSVNALFSGRYGKDNGIDAYYKMFRLKESVKILPEFLKELNYFTACDLLSEKIISKRGFDLHQFHDEYNDDLTKRHPEFLKKCLEKANGKSFFTFLHFTRIHTVTVSEILKKYEWNDERFYNNKQNNLLNYDNTFKEAGSYTKLIYDTIKKLGIDNETIIIFFSDHGTGVGERFGERNYGSFTFEETIRSFYLFIGQKIVKNRINENLRESIDMLPTILELIGIKPHNLPGESITQFLINKDKKLENKSHVFSETGALQGPHPSPMEPNVFCIKNSRHKLIFMKTTNEWKLFDLIKDPNEEKNIIDENPEIVTELRNKLNLWMER
jgi:arylsulfatase A-like enzyme